MKSTSAIIPHQIETLMQTCRILGMQFELLDDFSNHILKVSHNEKSYIFGAGNICSFPINSATSVLLTKDKSHTINILKKYNYKVPEGNYFFTQKSFTAYRGSGKEREDALEYAEKIGYPLYVKPNDGSRGAYVEKVFNMSDLDDYINRNSSKFYCFRIEKPLKGREYRLFVVDGKIWFGYRRSPPSFVFDGKRTVEAQLEELFEEQGKYGFQSLDFNSSFIKDSLSRNSFELTSIPSQGERFEFSPAMNLSIGGEVRNYSETFPEYLNNFTSDIARLFNLRVFGIDVYIEKSFTDNTSPYILEINGNPSLQSASQYSQSDIVHRLWKYIICEIFKL